MNKELTPLEEAAENGWLNYEHRFGSNLHANVYVDAFKAGVEWKAQQPIKDGWVSVDDRLPEIDDSVMVAFNNGDVDHDWYDKEFNHWSRLRYDTRKVTHWQPLPEPPNK